MPFLLLPYVGGNLRWGGALFPFTLIAQINYTVGARSQYTRAALDRELAATIFVH